MNIWMTKTLPLTIDLGLPFVQKHELNFLNKDDCYLLILVDNCKTRTTLTTILKSYEL